MLELEALYMMTLTSRIVCCVCLVAVIAIVWLMFLIYRDMMKCEPSEDMINEIYINEMLEKRDE